MNQSKACKVKGCGKEVKSMQLCQMHYSRLQRWGDVGGAEPLRVYGRPSICQVKECKRLVTVKGFCGPHGYRLKKYGDPLAGPALRLYMKNSTDEERFWARVNDPDSNGCRTWTGGQDGKGYGFFSVANKPIYAHRWIYEQQVGRIPDGYVIDHLCRIPLCQNTEHMEAVSIGENTQRSPTSNRNKTHCAKGHPYTPDNIYWHGPDKRWRACRTCVLANQKLAYREGKRHK